MVSDELSQVLVLFLQLDRQMYHESSSDSPAVSINADDFLNTGTGVDGHKDGILVLLVFELSILDDELFLLIQSMPTLFLH